MTSHTLVLLRHGKAEAAGPGRSDADRPLSRDGKADAAAAGEWLAAHGLLPNLVLCSPARRAVQTWNAVAAAAGPKSAAVPAVGYEPRLYTQGVQTVLGLLADVPDELSTLLIVGHNPTISLLSALLSPPFDGQGLSPAGLAVHRSGAGWADWAATGAPLVLSYAARATTEVPSPHQGTDTVTN